MKIIYPPRPKGKIPPSQLDKWEKKNRFVAQRKFNGHRNLVHRGEDGQIAIFGRYGKPHSKYRMPAFLRDELASLAWESGRKYWLDGELLHPRIPDTIVLYDVLQDGNYLFGTKLLDRLARLRHLCRSPSEPADPPIALRVTPHVWLAETFTQGFSARFSDYIDLDLIEGLVIKEVESGLDSYGHVPYNVDWQWRCRKPGASYLN